MNSILEQVTDGCEIVVLDGASTDATRQVILQMSGRHPRISYHRQEINDGIDLGFDHAVELARGEYCWLFPDDDFLKPGAVKKVLDFLMAQDYSVIFLNTEFRTFDMETVLGLHDPNITEDKTFRGEELDEIFLASWNLARYFGSTVIRRSIWLSRSRSQFVGSFWIYLGVIFQEILPGPVHVVAAPQVMIRMENQSWLDQSFYAFYVSWPKLINSFRIAESTKQSVLNETHKSIRLANLLIWSAVGQFSVADYNEHIRPFIASRIKRAVTFCIASAPSRVTYGVTLLYAYLICNPSTRRHVLKGLRSRK